MNEIEATPNIEPTPSDSLATNRDEPLTVDLKTLQPSTSVAHKQDAQNEASSVPVNDGAALISGDGGGGDDNSSTDPKEPNSTIKSTNNSETLINYTKPETQELKVNTDYSYLELKIKLREGKNLAIRDVGGMNSTAQLY